ncbi:MAG: PQQ-dependent sugar dehydrogenase [Pseudomonadales bacterium]|nr:PQQ-dependent sugar dehydrogenase [Pseudomonadales bacterium]
MQYVWTTAVSGVFLSLIVATAYAEPENLMASDDEFAGPSLYENNCAVCHGEQLEGAAQGVPLVGGDLKQGETLEELMHSIAKGMPEKGMVAWEGVLSDLEIKTLALLVKEYRSGLVAIDLTKEVELPPGEILSTHHNFKVDRITDQLDPFPYSISVLPDNSLLVTEKMFGIRTVSAEGQVSALIDGAPKTHNDVYVLAEQGIEFGAGWILDIQVHPLFQENGWVYLHYTERCRDCGDVMDDDNPPTSRNVVVRGRIDDGHWRDHEVIWSAPDFEANYYLDVVAGGRLAFDPEGYLFMTVGMRDMDGIQDLSSPYGKTHRVHDDGRVPSDNPFVEVDGAYPTIWTVGHRSPQGLAFDASSRQVWGTEHGPRGGDEINLLTPGGNFGWPLFSGGQNYDGTEVAHGRASSELEFADTVQPTVEFTPSIAISNLVVYQGAMFAQWHGDFLVGSLKATDLFRIRLDDGQIVEQEILLKDVGRIRDIDVSASGAVYLLLEHRSGGQIVRMASP